MFISKYIDITKIFYLKNYNIKIKFNIFLYRNVLLAATTLVVILVGVLVDLVQLLIVHVKMVIMKLDLTIKIVENVLTLVLLAQDQQHHVYLVLQQFLIEKIYQLVHVKTHIMKQGLSVNLVFILVKIVLQLLLVSLVQH